MKRKNSNIELVVEDQGIGIIKEDLDNIFGMLTVGSKTKSPAGGRGAGLALAKKITEMHNGKIWAEING